jgi:signal peptidase
LVVAALFLVYVAVPYFGNKALIVRSGSMQPAIGVGDLVVVHQSSRITAPAPGIFPKYKVGDIVAFSGGNSKVLTTHRIVNVATVDGKISYQTRGDANNAPDDNQVSEDKILGKTTIKIAGLGKIFTIAKTRNGFLALVVLPAVMVIIFELINIVGEIARIRQKKSLAPNAGQEARPSNILIKVLLPFVVGVMFFQGSFSSYADTEISTGNLLEAAESFRPIASPSPTPTPTPSPTPEASPGD